jgi:DNA polymerase-1
MRKLLLIDANSIIHRSFHALPPFTGPDGRPTGALYGISAILLKLWKEEKPEYVAALFDRPEPTFRDKKYKEYKAQRPPTVDELISQIIEARDLFRAFGVPVFEKAGYEADDLIATFAERFRNEADVQVVILTGDRDTLQLVEGDHIVVRIFNKGVSDTTIFDEAAIIEKYQLKPSQLIDYKSLVGDPSDNIKGVPGIGPKTATDILKEYASVERFLKEAPPESKNAERLKTFIKEAELAKELVTLDRHVPVEVENLEALALHDDKETIATYFKTTLGSATLLKRLEGKEATDGPAMKPVKKPKNPQTPLF